MVQPNFVVPGPPVVPELQAGDALFGGKAIQEFRNQLLGADTSLSAVFKQLGKGQIPAQKTPSGYVASKRGLRQFYARGTGLAA